MWIRIQTFLLIRDWPYCAFSLMYKVYFKRSYFWEWGEPSETCKSGFSNRIRTCLYKRTKIFFLSWLRIRIRQVMQIYSVGSGNTKLYPTPPPVPFPLASYPLFYPSIAWMVREAAIMWENPIIFRGSAYWPRDGHSVLRYDPQSHLQLNQDWFGFLLY